MTASPVIVSQRAKERDYLLALNDRFQNYVSRVRTMREQSKSIENHTFIAHTQALENELFEVKSIYDKELEATRSQLDLMTSERNSYQLEASKKGALATDYQDKYNNELTTRKKLENALADAHRLLSEKDSLIQELRITIAQHQNAHLDTTKERDTLQSTLNSVQTLCDSESKARADLEASVQKLSDQLSFERQLHDKALMEMNNKLSAAERAISIADEKLREHDIVDDNLAQTIAKMRMQTQAEFRRFQDESESAYQASLAQIKAQLDVESKNLSQSNEENIHLKAIIEEMNAKIGKLDSRCNAVEDQNRSLIHTLECERQQAQNTIKELEHKLREMQEHLNTKIRELNVAYNAQIPMDLEIEAFANLLDAEEKRLSVALANPPSELVQTARGDLVSSRGHYTSVRSLPGSPRKPVAGINNSPTSFSSRPKSVPVNEDFKDIPRSDSPGKPSSPSAYYLPGIGDNSSSCCISHVDATGKYIRLFNSSTYQDENIGGYIIQQNTNGRPSGIFRFPPKIIIKASCYTTVWSASSLAKHNPPTDFLWKAQACWRTGINTTTILSKPNGHAICWTNSSTSYTPQTTNIEELLQYKSNQSFFTPQQEQHAQNMSYSEANELLKRARYNASKLTSQDVVRPPTAKPRLPTGDEAKRERPSTVHVSNIHQHLHRAHQISQGVTQSTTQRPLFVKTTHPTTRTIRSAPLLHHKFIKTY